MTPKECKAKLLALAALMDELPEDARIIDAKAEDGIFTPVGKVHLKAGLESTAEVLGLEVEEPERDPYGRWYERRLTMPEDIRFYQLYRKDREAAI